ELSMYVDTDAEISLIDTEIAKLFFPQHLSISMPDNHNIRIRGIDIESDIFNIYINLNIIIKDQKSFFFFMKSELHLVKYLDYNIILVNDILTSAE
ncbi:hypothetical protein ACO22_07687, partial [Paracoccidioides brasiliensis]